MRTAEIVAMILAVAVLAFAWIASAAIDQSERLRVHAASPNPCQRYYDEAEKWARPDFSGYAPRAQVWATLAVACEIGRKP